MEVWINIDEHVLTGIIHNLLDNAVKYSDSGTEISVQTHTEKKRYVISVKDHGKGIAKSQQAAIFNKFHRVMEKDLHFVKGMGLGLYLCQVNIKRLNGSITVASEPFKGSTFTICLPNK